MTNSGRARSTAGRGTVGGAHWTSCGLMVGRTPEQGGELAGADSRNCNCTFGLTSHFTPFTPIRVAPLFALAGSSAQCWPSFLLLSPQQNPNFFFPRCRPPTRSGQSTRTRSQRSRPSSQTGTRTTSSRPSTTPEGRSTPPSTESRPVSPAFLSFHLFCFGRSSERWVRGLSGPGCGSERSFSCRGFTSERRAKGGDAKARARRQTIQNPRRTLPFTSLLLAAVFVGWLGISDTCSVREGVRGRQRGVGEPRSATARAGRAATKEGKGAHDPTNPFL